MLLIFYALWEATSPRFFAAQSASVYVAVGAGNVLGMLSVAFLAATARCFGSPRSRLRHFPASGLSDSEVYAPDEADGLMTLAQSVGTALGALSVDPADPSAMARELAARRMAIEGLRA